MSEGTIFSRMLGSALGTFTPKASGADRILRADNVAFRVVEEKRGGMGIVCICDPLSPDGTEIAEDRGVGPHARLALKTFPEAFFFDQRINQAFRNELFIWTRLRGVPFIVPAFDQVIIDGKPHIVMAAIPPDDAGRISLADHIQSASHGLSPDLCLSVALSIAIGMERATEREAGLVHGDIKPSNILMMSDYAMIADFGIARAGKVTGVTGISGTEAYMAPECWPDQDTGRAAFSTASDLYAFGCTLLHGLTGRVPFAGEGETLRQAHCSGMHARTVPADGPELALVLQELANHCIQIDPDARPDSFAMVRASLEEIARREAPVVLHQIQRFANDGMMLTMMSGGGARRLLDETPEEQFRDVDSISAGSAASLCGDDERALQFFNRFEAACGGAAHDDIALCANEKGLSLARLKRYDEAVKTFTNGLTFASGQRRAGLIANRAMSHLQLGDTSSAGRALERLLREHPDLSEVWGQLALVRIEEKQATEAEDAIRRAIALEPRNGQFRAILGEIQMDLRRDVVAAKASLDLAYDLGTADPSWARRMVVCCLLTGASEDASSILHSVSQNLDKEAADAFARETVEAARSFLFDAETGAYDDQESESQARPDVSEVQTPGDIIAPTPPAPPDMPADTADDIPLADQINAGGTYLNTKVYIPENTFSHDFYKLTDRPGYAEACIASIRQFAAHSTGSELFVQAEARVRPYAFWRCQACSFAILTNRDPGESLLCRMCDAKHPVVFTEEPNLDVLAKEVNASLGLDGTQAVDGAFVLVAFWPTDAGQLGVIKHHLEASGFEHLDDAPSAAAFIAANARARGVIFEGMPEVWSKPAAPGHTPSPTPAGFQETLRAIRREAGQTTSISMTAPPEMLPLLLAGEDALGNMLLADLRKGFDATPTDSANARRLVETRLRSGTIDEARVVFARLRQSLATPDADPDALFAGAQIAREDGDLVGADDMLERALQRAPRDQLARMTRLEVLKALGDNEKSREVHSELIAHGDPMTTVLAHLTGGSRGT